jgi:ribonuclease PH
MAAKKSFRRHDGRSASQLRKIKIKTGINRYAEGSCLIEMGNTQVLCLVSVEESVPKWREELGEGWVTSEYAMLPRATHSRTPRESVKGKLSGRTQEISRLLGRSLRAVVDFKKLGPRTITVDCEVLQADGGTRCAGINGGFLALALACRKLKKKGLIIEWPLNQTVAAVSVGLISGSCCLDLSYEEDSSADVDMNVVMTGDGRFIEIQGTAEHHPFTQKQADQMIQLARRGIEHLTQMQRKMMAPWL